MEKEFYETRHVWLTAKWIYKNRLNLYENVVINVFVQFFVTSYWGFRRIAPGSLLLFRYNSMCIKHHFCIPAAFAFHCPLHPGQVGSDWVWLALVCSHFAFFTLIMCFVSFFFFSLNAVRQDFPLYCSRRRHCCDGRCCSFGAFFQLIMQQESAPETAAHIGLSADSAPQAAPAFYLLACFARNPLQLAWSFRLMPPLFTVLSALCGLFCSKY